MKSARSHMSVCPAPVALTNTQVGHAVCGTLTAGHDPVQKVTLIPRGQARGLTWFIPGRFRCRVGAQGLVLTCFGTRSNFLISGCCDSAASGSRLPGLQLVPVLLLRTAGVPVAVTATGSRRTTQLSPWPHSAATSHAHTHSCLTLSPSLFLLCCSPFKTTTR